MNLKKIRRTAAEVLALAVYETFPEVELLGGFDTSFGFFYDFIFPHPIHPEFHHQIEEKMRQIVREKREIRDLEMLGVSAKEFLKSRGHKERAKQVDGSGLFPIVQIGTFIDLAAGDHLADTGELPAFKLFPPEIFESQVLRMTGVAAESKEALKEFLKKWNSYSKKRHEKVGEIKNYWRLTKEGFIWLPDGLKAMDALVHTVQENLIPKTLQIRLPKSMDPASAYKKILQEMNIEEVFEICDYSGERNENDPVGLLEPIEGRAIQITISLKNLISSLHSIGKTLIILGFSYCVHLTRSKRNAKGGSLLEDALKDMRWEFEASEEVEGFSRVDFLVSDGLGRQWSAASVYAKECLHVQVVIERNLALLLEL